MRILNTITTDMKDLKWDITSFNMPYFIVEPPSPFYNYYSPIHANLIDDKTHETLLNESLNLYDDIWTTMAQM